MFLKKNTIFKKCIHFLKIQLFLSLLSLPVLIAWGLPISLMTFVGNFFISTYLFVFLFFSLIIFFCILFSINGYCFILCLEYISKFLSYWLYQANPAWLYAFDIYAFFFSIFISLCACIIFHHHFFNTAFKQIVSFLLLYGLLFMFQEISLRNNKSFLILVDKNHYLKVERKNKKLYVSDYNNTFGAKKITENWLIYTFLPQLSLLMGKQSIDELRVKSINYKIKNAIKILKNHILIKKIMMLQIT